MKVDLSDWKMLLRSLFWIRGGVWVILSYLYAVSYLGVQRDSGIVPMIIPALLLVTALVYFVLGWFVRKPTRLLWLVSIVFLVVQVLLTVTDQMGMVDVFSLLVDGALVLLVFMWRDRFPRGLPGV